MNIKTVESKLIVVCIVTVLSMVIAACGENASSKVQLSKEHDIRNAQVEKEMDLARARSVRIK